MPDIRQFYQRIDPNIDLNKFLKKLSSEYNFGNYIKWELIPFGYSDFNIRLYTSRSEYFIKIFAKSRKMEEINEIINRFLNLYKSNVPVPRTYLLGNDYLYSLNNLNLIVMEYINGSDFTNRKVRLPDIKKATEILAKINNLAFEIKKSYDSWGTMNLITEFEKRKKYLAVSDMTLIEKVINDFKKINFSKFQYSIIHGDFHGEHFLKDSAGKYWVIDVETMGFAPSVVDLGIFLATFPLNKKYSLGSDKTIYNFVLSEYLKRKKLNEIEISNIYILIKSTYAIYFIRANYEKLVNKDKSYQTEYWLEWSRRGLISSI